MHHLVTFFSGSGSRGVDLSGETGNSSLRLNLLKL